MGRLGDLVNASPAMTGVGWHDHLARATPQTHSKNRAGIVSILARVSRRKFDKKKRLPCVGPIPNVGNPFTAKRKTEILSASTRLPLFLLAHPLLIAVYLGIETAVIRHIA